MNIVEKLQGPILVIGSTGFIGRNMVQYIRTYRNDVYEANRLNIVPTNVKTVFNLSLGLPEFNRHHTFIHAGSSMEYGDDCDAPEESMIVFPFSDYGKKKLSQTEKVWFRGRYEKIRCCTLRLYNVYGKYDHSEKLIPRLHTLCRNGKLPNLGNPDASYDLVHVDDVCRAFVLAALSMDTRHYGEAFNIGTGISTTLKEIVNVAKTHYNVSTEPQWNVYTGGTFFGKPWRANTKRSKITLGFEAQIPFEEGFKK